MLLLLMIIGATSSSIYAQQRMSSSLGKTVEGVIRIKFSGETVDNFSTIQVKSTSINTSSVFTTGLSDIDVTNNNPNVFEFKRVFSYSEKHEAKHRKHGLHQWYEVRFDSSIDVETMMDNYENLDGVEIIKPVFQKVNLGADNKMVVLTGDELKKLQTVSAKSSTVDDERYPFDDPLLIDQWHYENFGDIAGNADADIDLFGAWKIETGNDSVIVAIIDGGIDYDHVDLADAMWINDAEKYGQVGVDDDENGFIDDIYGYNFKLDQGSIVPVDHGTHVAGTVGAVSNNGTGVSGVAGGDGTTPGVRLMSCQIFTDDGSSEGTAQAYIYAADNGAVVAQSSWSYSSPSYSEADVDDAIQYFYDEAGDFEGSKVKGGVLLFSAGNSTLDDVFYPAASPLVLGVTSTGPYNTPSSFSNYNVVYDITAPGGDKLDDGSDAGGILSTYVGDDYGYMSGTSMSTPHVSGVAALIISNSSDDELTNEDVYSKLVNYVSPFAVADLPAAYLGKMGAGHLNALNCLNENEGVNPEPVEDFRVVDLTHQEISMEWQIPVDSDDIKPTSYTVFLSEEVFTAEDYSSAQQLSLYYDGEIGDTVTANLSGLTSDTEFWLAVKAVDFWGNASTMSPVLKVRTVTPPLFTLDNYTYQVKVDIRNRLYFDTIVTIVNKGEGELSWSTEVLNSTYLFPELIDSTYWFPEVDTTDISTTGIVTKSASMQNDNTIATSPIIPGTMVETDPLDNTIYTAALYSDDFDVLPQSVYGDFDLNHTIIQATQFSVPLGYGFNMTHAESWVYYQENTAPLKMEIRTGKDLLSSKLVYQRFYNVDTTGVVLSRIPLEKPIYFEESSYFWILLEHPKNETMPVVHSAGDCDVKTSYLSINSGYDWVDWTIVHSLIPQQMKIRAYSVGDDPTYVYLDPTSGTVSGHDSTEAHMYVNIENLRNGSHTAYLNIYTNDYWATANSVSLELLVSGQSGELEYEEDLNVFDLVYGRSNDIVLDIENIGLGNLKLEAISFDSEEWSAEFDTAAMLPTQPGEIVFTYTPEAPGLKSYSITITTDAGEYLLSVDAATSVPSEVEYTMDTLRVSLHRGKTESVSFNIKNVSDIDLDYDVYSTPTPTGEWAKSRIYTYEVSEPINDPTRWDEVNEEGTRMTYYFEQAVPLTFRFPFYDQELDYGTFDNVSALYFGTSDQSKDDLPNADGPKGSIIPLANNFSGSNLVDPVYSYYKGYGNRFVIQTDSAKLYRTSDSTSLAKSSFQVAIFKDGSIEYRYNKIDTAHYMSALIGLQDFSADSALLVKSASDTTFVLHDHDYLRITPHESASFLGRLSSDNGRLMPDESLEISVDINPDSSQLVTGTYLNKIRVDMNTKEGAIYIPVILEVIGDYDSISVDTSKVEFGDLYTETLYTDTVWVTNHSDDPSEIVNFSSDIAGVSLRNVNTTFAPHEIKRLLIDFIPEEMGQVDSVINMTISTTGADFVYVFEFTANVEVSPTFTLDAVDTYHFDLDSLVKDTVVRLYNTSSTTSLKYQIFGGSFVSIAKVESAISTKSNSVDASYVPLEDDELFSRLAHYGLVDSSYSYQISDERENAVQYFMDELSSYDETEKLTIEKNTFYPVALKFPFMFYGESRDTVWVNENGYVTLVKPEVDADPLTLNICAEDDGVSGIVAPLWGDWSEPLTETDGLFMLNAEDRFILQWRNVYTSDPSSPGLVSFELILFNDGRVKFVYKDINDYMGLFDYGIEAPNERHNIDLGRESFDINAFGVYRDSSAITLVPALFGEVPANGSVDLRISASPQYMLTDDYTQQIIIKTNAVHPTPNDTILITADVTTAAAYAKSDTIDFGTHYYQEEMTVTSDFWINNRGGESMYLQYFEPTALPGFELQSQLGYEIWLGSFSQLKASQVLLPGELITYNVSYSPDSVLGTTYGKLEVELEDGVTFEFPTKLTLEDAPKLYSETADTAFAMNQFEETEFSFDIMNTGGDTLQYSTTGLFDAAGTTYDDPTAAPGAVFDSLSYVGNKAEGLFSNLDGYSFVMMTAIMPESDFELTHVKTYGNIIYQEDFVIRLQVLEYEYDTLYDKIAPDSLGTPVFTQEYRFEDDLGEKWRHMTLAESLTLEEGKTYIVQMFFPYELTETEVLGTETCFDFEKLKMHYWCSGTSLVSSLRFDYIDIRWLPMVKFLSGGTSEGFLELTPTTGVIAPDETKTIDVKVDAFSTKSGVNIGTVITRGINTTDDSRFTVEVDINAKPDFTYTPTNDTLVIQEKVPYVGSYLINDPEGDDITCSLIDDDGLDITMESKTDDYLGLYQIKFNTGWEDQGVYDVVIEAADVHGNVNYDTLTVEVYNINRSPVFTFDDAIVINKAHDEVFQTNMNEMFTDPDNDEMSFEVGNGNPELYDMALMQDEVIIVPIETGVGYVAFIANDGYDDGYVGYYYYVYVIDDASVAPSQDGLETMPTEELDIETLFTAPNPTTGNSGVYFNLKEDMHVTIELYDAQGRSVKNVINASMTEGNRYVEIPLSDLSPGVYFYKVVLGNSEAQMVRLLKN